MSTTSKPGILELVGSSWDYFIENKEIYWSHIKPLLPFIIALEIGGQIIGKMGMDGAALVFSLFLIYFYACYALACHKTSLMGPSTDNTTNPFSIKPEDKRFFKFFYLMFFIPLCVGFVIGAGGAAMAKSGSGGLVMLAAVVAVVAFIYMMIELMRISFILPASSVGMKINIKEARQVSKGLLWKLVGSTGLLSIIAVVIIMLYTMIVGLTVAIILAGVGQGPVQYFFEAIFALPILLFNIVLTGMFVNILSRLYQWGMQHNA